MRVHLDLNEENFAYIEDIAIPFQETTPESVIYRIIEEHRNKISGKAPTPMDKPLNKNLTHYSSSNPPPLKHTKVMQAEIGSLTPDKMTWDACLRSALTLLFQMNSSVQDVKNGSGAHIVEGKKEVEGFKYLKDLNLSYQGSSAEQTASAIFRATKYLGVPARIEFVWRDKADAFKPNQRGILT